MSIEVRRLHRAHSNFTQISNDYLHADLPPTSKLVGIELLSYPAGFATTHERIADALGLHRNTITKAMRDLEAAGYIRSEPRYDTRGRKSGANIQVSDVGFADESCTENVHDPDAPSTPDVQTVHKKEARSCTKNVRLSNTETKTQEREPRERETEPPQRSRPATLSENFQPKIQDLARLTELPEDVVREEMDSFRNYMTDDGRKRSDWDAEALKWLRNGKRRRANAEDRAPNVTRLHGQGELFAPPRLTPEQREAKLAWIDKSCEEQTARQRALEAAIQARKLTHPDETPEQRSRRAQARYA